MALKGGMNLLALGTRHSACRSKTGKLFANRDPFRRKWKCNVSVHLSFLAGVRSYMFLPSSYHLEDVWQKRLTTPLMRDIRIGKQVESLN